MPAANGADADVPVCSTVQMRSGRNRPSISTVATLLSWPGVPELYVVANVDEHSSKYHGLYLFIGDVGNEYNGQIDNDDDSDNVTVDDSDDTWKMCVCVWGRERDRNEKRKTKTKKLYV